MSQRQALSHGLTGSSHSVQDHLLLWYIFLFLLQKCSPFLLSAIKHGSHAPRCPSHLLHVPSYNRRPYLRTFWQSYRQSLPRRTLRWRTVPRWYSGQNQDSLHPPTSSGALQKWLHLPLLLLWPLCHKVLSVLLPPDLWLPQNVRSLLSHPQSSLVWLHCFLWKSLWFFRLRFPRMQSFRLCSAFAPPHQTADTILGICRQN